MVEFEVHVLSKTFLTLMCRSNDVFDHETGADQTKKESIVNLTRNKPLIFWLSLVFLSMGAVFLGNAILLKRSPLAFVMLGLATACGYLYQGPPFRFALLRVVMRAR